MTSSYSTDIVIFGGGIAGLWLLNRLRNEGYQAILLETNKLGGGQTLASQGIIHGGLKYALNGTLSGVANVISAMPSRWRSCLAGEGELDLSACRVLSEHYYLWSDSDLRSKLKTFLGSKSLHGRVNTVEKQDYPDFFRTASVNGTLYKLPDFVIDTQSLLEVLIDKQKQHIYKIEAGNYTFSRNDSGSFSAVTLRNGRAEVRIAAQKFIFSAGEGNQDLINKAQLKMSRSQLRPLHMVYLKRQSLPSVFVHYIGNSFSLTPKLTVTSHTDRDGATVWYLGGEIAESGVGKDAATQIQQSQSLLASVFPWVDLRDAQWHCFTINRAEATVNNNFRPEDAYLAEENNVLVAWPTKLTLTPNLADKLIEHLASLPLTPSAKNESRALRDVLNSAESAVTPWE